MCIAIVVTIQAYNIKIIVDVLDLLHGINN